MTPLAKTKGREAYRLTEVADMLGVSPRTIRRWRREGELVAMKLPGGRAQNGTVLIEAAELARFKARHRGAK